MTRSHQTPAAEVIDNASSARDDSPPPVMGSEVAPGARGSLLKRQLANMAAMDGNALVRVTHHGQRGWGIQTVWARGFPVTSGPIVEAWGASLEELAAAWGLEKRRARVAAAVMFAICRGGGSAALACSILGELAPGWRADVEHGGAALVVTPRGERARIAWGRGFNIEWEGGALKIAGSPRLARWLHRAASFPLGAELDDAAEDDDDAAG